MAPSHRRAAAPAGHGHGGKGKAKGKHEKGPWSVHSKDLKLGNDPTCGGHKIFSKD
eukprot:gene1795-22760_t